MRKHKKTPKDVVLVRSEHGGDAVTWQEFATMANHEISRIIYTKYALDLQIVFTDGSCLRKCGLCEDGYWKYYSAHKLKNESKEKAGTPEKKGSRFSAKRNLVSP